MPATEESDNPVDASATAEQPSNDLSTESEKKKELFYGLLRSSLSYVHASPALLHLQVDVLDHAKKKQEYSFLLPLNLFRPINEMKSFKHLDNYLVVLSSPRFE